jgi:AraC-like DNA-binding protein
MKIRHYEFNPSEALQPFVDCYWYQEFDSTLHIDSPIQRCVPLGMTELIFHITRKDWVVLENENWVPMPDAIVVGVYKDGVIWKANSQCKAFGIRLKPEAMQQLFNIPAAQIVNTFTDIDTFFGKDMSSLTDKIYGQTLIPKLIDVAEQFLLSHLKRAGRFLWHVTEGTRLIRESKGDISLEELSTGLCISERQLQRCFKDSIGMGPKTYLRIIRFRNAYEYLQQNEGNFSWADVSYHFGYADQAHFIRDFKQFTGAVPSTMVSNNEQFLQMTGSSAN